MNKRTVGTAGESLAAAYLKDRGVRILETNFRCRSGEIDLVCEDEEYLVFAEVKYRKTPKAGSPLSAVTIQKQRTICRVADFYRVRHGIPLSRSIRYDVIGICGNEITWIKNAFPHRA